MLIINCADADLIEIESSSKLLQSCWQRLTVSWYYVTFFKSQLISQTKLQFFSIW